MKTRVERIKKALEEGLGPRPVVCRIDNVSHRHEGHAGDDGSGESHYNLTIVSACFSGLSRIERHRMINKLLAPVWAEGLHALSIKALAPEEDIKH